MTDQESKDFLEKLKTFLRDTGSNAWITVKHKYDVKQKRWTEVQLSLKIDNE